MPTILLKKSDTPGSVPGTANLTNLAGGAEVAVNTADKRMFSMTSASAVIELGTNPSSLTCADASFTVARVGSLTISSLSLTNATVTSATVTTLTGTSANITNISGTSLTVSTATLSAGTANGVLYLNGSKVATSGSGLQFDGTRLFVGTTTTSTSSTQSGEVYSTGAVGFMLTNTTAANFPVSIKNEGSSGTRNLIRFYEGPAGGTVRASVSLDGSNYLTFDTNNFIINTGNLGIGTTSPAVRLQILDGGANSTGTMRLGGATYYGTIQHDPVSTGANIYDVTSASGGGHIFRRGGSNLMLLDSSGNLGLGVTPSAWASDKRVLQFDNGASIYANKSVSAVYLGSNFYENSSGNPTYSTSTFASQYYQFNGQHVWRTAPSGTAGNAITFTQAATLDANGRFLVGTTNNTATARIVAGINTTTANTAFIGFENDSSGANDWAITLGSAVNNLAIRNVSSSYNALEFENATGVANFGINGNSFGSGDGVIFIKNSVAAPSANPTGGGILYVESGALKYRGSSGTVTTLANA